MPEKKKKPLLKRFIPYMGKKKALLPLSLILSGTAAALNILPYVFIWVIVRKILSVPGGINPGEIGPYAWLALASALGGVLFYFFSLMSSHLAAFRVEVGLQKVAMEKIRSMPLGFFDKNPSGKIRKVVNDGAKTTHSFLAHQLPDMAGSIVTPVILLILTFTVDWKMGICSLIPIIIGFSLMGFMMTDKGRAFQKQYMDSLEEMSAQSVDYIRGIPVVKTFGQTIFSFKRFHDSIMGYKEMVLAYTLMWRTPMSFYTIIMESAAFFLVPLAIFMIGQGGGAPLVLANFLFYLLIAPAFTQVLMRSMYFRQNGVIAAHAIDRIDELMGYPAMEYPSVDCGSREASLEFRNVKFTYDGTDYPALDGISFKVNRGETIALVGPSGGGKTTIARLAARFWDADEGEVLIGGESIRKYPKKQLMDRISFVFQSTRLFKGSLRDNIVFGKENVSDSEIDRAVEFSQSREIIDYHREGLETVIGSKGTYLSGGEQQRIALARAIVKDAPIVLLDEATAFADPENEHLIQKGMKELSRGKTTLMIAHRLTTVQNADRILVIEKGKIAQQGTHEDLLARGGLYETLWNEYRKSTSWKIAAKEAVGMGE
jgi:ATP-binding cassette, subfamily B, bacterial IrtA/YbtP